MLLTVLFCFFLSEHIDAIDNSFLDLKYRFKESYQKNSFKISKYILVVDDNDLTRQKLNHSPVNLKEWNRYLSKLLSFNTRTIALYLPIYFPDSNAEANHNFISIIQNHNNIILPYIPGHSNPINIRRDSSSLAALFHHVPGIESTTPFHFTSVSLPHDRIAKNINQIGYSNLAVDRDGVVRKIPLLAMLNGKTIFSYTLATLISFLDLDIKSMFIADNTLHFQSRKYKKNFEIPLTKNNEMYINFFKDINKRFFQTPLYKIILSDASNSPAPPDLGKYLVINVSTATISSQKYKTPVHPFMPGGFIVAAALNTIISEQFVRPRNQLDMILSLIVLAVILMGASLFFSPANKRILFFNRNAFFILFATLALAGYFIFTCLIFTLLNRELSTITPLLFILTFSLTASAYKLIVEDREKRLLTDTLRGFVSTRKLEFLMTPRGAELMLKTRQKRVSILLTDIVDFANWSTFHNPDFIFRTLKKYYLTLEGIIFKHDGTIDKKMGDALLAFFGDLDDDPGHVNHALSAAIEIQRELRKQNFPFLTRIGINSGEVMLGNLGTEKHLDYTAIGTAVNFTKRIEENCIPGGILIGPEAFNHIKNRETFDLSPVEIDIKEQEEVLICYHVAL